MKKTLFILLAGIMVFSFASCKAKTEKTLSAKDAELKAKYTEAHILKLSKTTATLDDKELTQYDYVWNYTPNDEEPYYTGKEPSNEDSAYISHDIIYYPEIDESAFTKQEYDGETEWVTNFTKSGLEDYLFSTLPVLGDELPANMMHSKDEAYNNPVIHIKEAGQYIVYGEWNGQILVDLPDSDKAFTDKTQKVTLILAGTDITCSVAPAVVFSSAYECDNKWEERETYSNTVDTTDAGANVILVDGTENNVTGANVFRLLKPKYKSEDTKVQKKLYKTDAAFYSFVSMNIDGETDNTGILNVKSTTFEGLDSELHLTINGGYINIVSQDDGINVNEDGVSVFTMNAGHLTVFAGQGAEGDVIDSNGYITVNGGYIAGASPSVSDDIFDCDCEKIISDKATVIDNTSGMQGNGPMGKPNDRGEPMPNGQMPEEMPPQGDNKQPPEKR